MTAFTASRDLRDWTTALASQPEPPALVLNEPSCYHFRVLDPRLPLCIHPHAAARPQRDRNAAGAARGVASPKPVRPAAGLNFSEFTPPIDGELPRVHVLSA
jgi:hypothetical protein